MTTSKLLRSPLAHRSGAILAAAFLLLAGVLLAGVRHADAAPSASGSSGSTQSSTAGDNTSRSASAATSASHSATSSASHSATSSASASGDTATSTGATSSSTASACPAQVRITLAAMTVSGGMVTISFTHNAHNCPSARPALLHIHQNLLATPRAGSDPVHQWNADLQIGPNHPDGVTVPLLKSADGKCFVQVDAHASGQSRGQFFPTTTCSSESPSTPASSSSAPTSTSATPTSAAPSTTSQSFLPESTSRATATRIVVAVGQSPPGGALASTGSSVAAPVALAVGLLVAGAGLMVMSRRPRRH